MIASPTPVPAEGSSGEVTLAPVSVPFHQPDISDLEHALMSEVLRSGWLTTGPKTTELEKSFARAVQAKHGIAVSSCSAALHLALDAFGIGAGDEVILPSLTFASTASAVVHLGATPILADICADDHTIDPDSVARLWSSRTKAVITVAFGGQPARMGPIMELARDRGVPVIEDAAHAFPAAYDGHPVGSVADVSCFSFYATKTLTAGEGGMATTESPEHAARMRLMSNHGISKNAHDRQQQGNNWYYEILDAGWKYNMPDLLAALGLAQLCRSETMWQRRAAIAEAYLDAFADDDSVDFIRARPECRHSWHLFVLKITPERLTIDRNRFIEELRQRSIATSVHFIPLHLQPFYRETYGASATDCTTALECYRRSISLPIYSTMTDSQVGLVVDAVRDVCRTFKR